MEIYAVPCKPLIQKGIICPTSDLNFIHVGSGGTKIHAFAETARQMSKGKKGNSLLKLAPQGFPSKWKNTAKGQSTTGESQKGPAKDIINVHVHETIPGLAVQP